MILKDLIKEIPFEEVKKRLNVLYPNSKRNIKGYENVYKLLLKKRPRKSTTIISLEWVEKEKDSDDGGYWDVHGREPNDDTRWALDLSTFSQWSGFTVGPELPLRKDKVTLLCHILWEMTFHGYSDKEIRNFHRKLKRAAKGPFKELKLEDL
jgi:hypothetical protein